MISTGHQDHAICTIRLFLWVYARDRVYADKPSTLQYLKINICHVMTEVSPNLCQKVFANYLKRDHLNDVWNVSHIMSTFKFTIKKIWKKIYFICILFPLTWDHEIDNPILMILNFSRQLWNALLCNFLSLVLSFSSRHSLAYDMHFIRSMPWNNTTWQGETQ